MRKSPDNRKVPQAERPPRPDAEKGVDRVITRGDYTDLPIETIDAVNDYIPFVDATDGELKRGLPPTTGGGTVAVAIEETGDPTTLLIGAIPDGTYLRRVGSDVVGDTPSGGSGSAGIVEVDFGAFPGASDASATVTGQTGITTGSVLQAWIYALATPEHSADEHRIETISANAGDIVAATGFTVWVQNTSQLNEPREPSQSGGRITSKAAASAFGNSAPDRGGQGTRLYGRYSVAWRWS
jgi:hypothetical protein